MALDAFFGALRPQLGGAQIGAVHDIDGATCRYTLDTLPDRIFGPARWLKPSPTDPPVTHQPPAHGRACLVIPIDNELGAVVLPLW